MNCLEFHRTKLADPRRLPAEAQAHAQDCASCAAFARSVDETERELERSLATSVPEGLADRILLRARGSPPSVWRRRALAAGVVVAAGAATIGIRNRPDKPSGQHARLAIEHVVMEPESLTTVRNADPDALQAVMQNFGATLKEPLGALRYIKLCPVENGMGWHIVFDTPEGLFTLFLVPGKQLEAMEAASASGWNALARPTRQGYYAVVTASTEATQRVDSIIRERVNWGV
jgi:hypothetical protein